MSHVNIVDTNVDVNKRRRWAPKAVAAWVAILVSTVSSIYQGKYYNVVSAESERIRKLEAAKLTYEIGDMYNDYVYDISCLKWCVPHLMQSLPLKGDDGREIKFDPKFAYDGYATYVLSTDNAVLSVLNRLDAISSFRGLYDGKFTEYTNDLVDAVVESNRKFIDMFRYKTNDRKAWMDIYPLPKNNTSAVVSDDQFYEWVKAGSRNEFHPLPGSKCRATCRDVANHVFGTVPPEFADEGKKARDVAGRQTLTGTHRARQGGGRIASNTARQPDPRRHE